MSEDEQSLLLIWLSLLSSWVLGTACDKLHDEEGGWLALGWLLGILFFLLLLCFLLQGLHVPLLALLCRLEGKLVESTIVFAEVNGTIWSWLELLEASASEWIGSSI